MSGRRLGTIVRLELTQRTRTTSWYVMLGVFAALLVGVTVLSFLAWRSAPEPGPWIYSTIVYITLLLVVLVSPTLSGNAINGDREAATLATVQVTLATTAEILFGKWFAAWITGLAFVAVATPFLIIATITGGGSALTILVSLLVLIVEVGLISAIGVALSGIQARPLFSVATTYLVVAALVIGTVIAFFLVGYSTTSTVTSTTRYLDYSAVDGEEPPCYPGEQSTSDWPCDEDAEPVCSDWETYTYEVPRYDYWWWILSANPFVILADATPTTYDRQGNVEDMFGQIKLGVRMAQQPPQLEYTYDECAQPQDDTWKSAEETIAGSTPSWFIGLGLQAVLAAALLWGASARTRTPARTLPPGTRIA
ncbi:ABC-type transport system involved in multi-copper enzyme maturation permease subunit [Microbacterium terrae]|uniref:ABC-2 family transporter protein n=1 Tax=Microbacterium terrae TaxID=69369 RepID=A0A0M2HH19_9MICO|nr:ABC transporter permease [Microbacterium terrae]KJL44045.1 ABC-2 family transporter protein [Microbacterium terrae]MBP1079420.1 ABC-type transport system involved in multi-copper enzyme maturation permease subunit [Microbacterium terrae]GLJ98820.1 ABC transporter permease [Microbacterium terrae]